MPFLRIARRLMGMLLVLVLATASAFVVLEATPGDAAQTLVGDSASEAELVALRRQLGLDRPLPVRFLSYLGSAIHGDLGRSLISGRPVSEVIGERFGYTLLLALTATCLATGLGLMIGICAAARHGRPSEMLLMGLMALGLAVPGFGLAMVFSLVFSLKLRLLPVAGGGTPAHLVLPALTMALPLTAVVARLARSSLLDAAGADYVLTARAKGLQDRTVWRKHILKNALIPVVTMISLNFGHLLGGAFVVETIFSWPGLGRLIVQSVFDKDYPVILGAVVLLAVIFQLFNLLIDLLYGVLDPRIGSEAV